MRKLDVLFQLQDHLKLSVYHGCLLERWCDVRFAVRKKEARENFPWKLTVPLGGRESAGDLLWELEVVPEE